MSDRGLFLQFAPRGLALSLVVLAGVWLGAVPSWAAEPVAPAPAAKSSPPPLLLEEEEAPLLLNEAPNPPPALAGASGVDINAACYVCHANFRQDPFVQWHAKTNIGCVRCHGDSPAHVADEANLTPPESMYWPSRIRVACFGCHPVHKAPAHEVLARWAERCPQKTNASQVVCTDCHGAHRMDVRSVVWDKRTGRLLSKAKPIIIRAAAEPAAPAPKAAAATLATKDSVFQNANENLSR